MDMPFRKGVMAGLAVLLAVASGVAEARPPSRPAVASASRHPVSNLPVIPLTAGGHRLRVELAASSAEQETGLMFRARMGADEGMLFPMSPPRQAYFWMRNTIIPLDIIFIGADRRVLNVAANARPYDETPLPSAGKAAAVLELNGGRAAQLGIRAGTKVSW